MNHKPSPMNYQSLFLLCVMIFYLICKLGHDVIFQLALATNNAASLPVIINFCYNSTLINHAESSSLPIG